MIPRPVFVAGSTALLLLVAACAAGDERFVVDGPAGFWAGLWHGILLPLSFLVSLFVDGWEIYELHNVGGWYDFGYVIGVSCFGVGGGKASHRRVKRASEREWEEIGEKVEAKIRHKIRRWAEAEPGEEWDDVERKAEEKLKAKLKKWAEEPG